MRETPRHILVFEPDARGHAPEWLSHLLWEAGEPGAPRISLAIPDALAEKLHPELPADCVVIPLTEEERRRCLSSNLVASAFARWRALRRGLRESGAEEGLFLGFDHPLLPFALGLGAGGAPVSGILFRPTVHYGELGFPGETWRERLRDRQKEAILRAALRNPAVARVYSLDPYFPGFAARRYGAGGKVEVLGDPAFPPVEASPDDRALAKAIPDGRTSFLLFGELTERKGVLPFLESLKLLPSPIASRVAVTLAGRLDPGIADQVQALLRDLERDQPNLWVNLANRWLADGEVAALVSGSDVVMAPYQRFVGSSGVLIWAARCDRPVICQDYGLLGRLTENYGLGVTVDSRDPHALASAIATAVERGGPSLGPQEARDRFLESRSPRAFARQLLFGDPATAEEAVADPAAAALAR